MRRCAFIDHLETGFRGLTLPVWVAAAAQAATEVLLGRPFVNEQQLRSPDCVELLSVQVSSAALLAGGQRALAISFCDPGQGLDLTRGLEIWVFVEWQQSRLSTDDQSNSAAGDWLKIVPGFGVGTLGSGGEACLSGFACELLQQTLRPLVPAQRCLQVEVVLPRGKDLALRTSNAAFGVVDGLALIGTQAEVQTSASPDQLQQALEQLRQQCAEPGFSGALTLVIGENGLDLAHQLGLTSQPLLKAGNWMGPLLLAAAEAGVEQLLLFGYHGKLVKLAGGIFHTHHHLADARLEVLTAMAVREGLSLDTIRLLAQSESMEAALNRLEAQDSQLAKQLWDRLAAVVEQRSADYISRYGSWSMTIGSALFDRQRRLRWAGPLGVQQLTVLGVIPEALH